MKLTKYEHACFVTEKEGKKTVVDPGGYTTDLETPRDVVAIIITHEHADHMDLPTIERVVDSNPGITILGHESLADQLQGLPFRAVTAGNSIDIEPFHFEFFGGEHAQIHPALPSIANFGVMIDGTLYYPGDSFTLPGKPVNVLALPVSAPWLKLSEAIDFMIAIQPKTVFPTHDAILSQNGDVLIDRMMGMFAEKNNAEYRRLTGTIEI